jgi:5-methylcytosine-specific restriction enzyme A
MVISRSREMVLVGYFLSRCTVKNQESKDFYPPNYLKTSKWYDAYLMFYRALGGGRTWSQFHHSLKNIRDSFDSHLNSGRVGWYTPHENGLGIREPQTLTNLENKIFVTWKNLSNDELWDEVKPFVNSRLTDISPEYMSEVIEEMESQQGIDEIISYTEGGEKIIKSRRLERSEESRRDALKFHGHICMVCGFDFNKKYGEWGDGYTIVHHMSPLGKGGERKTNPVTDLAVVCANCHAMIHRKPGITLTLDELRSKIKK